MTICRFGTVAGVAIVTILHLLRQSRSLVDEADGDCASLAWVTIKGDRYIIREYDGLEGITTPEDINWVVVQPTEK